MLNISKYYLLPNIQEHTEKLSSLTNQSETRLQEDKISYSPTIINSIVSEKLSFMPMESNTNEEVQTSQGEQNPELLGRRMMLQL
jgi:hypothetical protein